MQAQIRNTYVAKPLRAAFLMFYKPSKAYLSGIECIIRQRRGGKKSRRRRQTIVFML
jgi:hypothetical protein